MKNQMTILLIISEAIFLTFFSSLSDKIILFGPIIFPVVITFTLKVFTLQGRKNQISVIFPVVITFTLKVFTLQGRKKSDFATIKDFLATEINLLTSPQKHVKYNCVTIFSAVRNLNNFLVLDSKKIVNIYMNER